MFRFFTSITRHLLFFGLCFVAIAISIVRVMIFCVDLYKTELEVELSELLATPVKVGQLRAFMRGFNPEVVLKNITLSNSESQQHTVQLKEVRLGINVLKLLRHQHLLASSWVTLVGAKLSLIRQVDGSFEIEGLKGGEGQPVWLLEGDSYQILDSEITWLDKKRQGKAVTFKNVDLMIKNRPYNNQHQAHLVTHLPSKYGQKLRISVDFSGNVFEPDNLIGQVFIQGQQVQFAHLITGDLPLNLHVKRGLGDFKLWGFWQKNQLTALSGSLDLKNLHLHHQNQHSLDVQHLKTNFAWQNQPESWRLDVQDFNAKINNKSYPSAEFVIGSANKTNQHIGANITRLDLAQVKVFQQFFAPALTDIPPLFKQLHFKGLITNSLLFADLSQQLYAIKAQFKYLSLNHPDYPQLENLSGFVEGTQHQGRITLNSQNAVFQAKKVFKQPLKITDLIGSVDWQQQAENWLLSTTNLELKTPHLHSYHQAKITLSKQEKPPFLDMQTTVLNINDVSQIKHYFPSSYLETELVTWLDEAFVRGKVKRVDMSIYGALADFPFKKNQGMFQVLFSPEKAELKYAPDWPHFKSLSADVMFLNDSLEVKLKRTTSGKMAGRKIKVTIPSLSKGDYLYAQGKFKGKLNDGLDFLHQTPLGLPIDDVRENLKLKGNTEIDLALTIPLEDSVNTKVKGSARFQRASLNVTSVDIDVSRLKGQLMFTETGLYAKKLTAMALGEVIDINIDTVKDKTSINVTGKVSAESLFKTFDFKQPQLAQGLSPYSLAVTLPHQAERLGQVTIASDLTGMAINLPDGLGKSAWESKALTLDVYFTQSQQALLPISLDYGQLKANLRYHKQREQLYSGNILLGQGGVKKPKQAGFNIDVKLPQFSLLEWHELLQSSDEKNAKSLLNRLDIDTPKLLWQQQDLGRFKLNLYPKPSTWNGNIVSKMGTGRFQMPNDITTSHPIKLEMQTLNLSALEKLKWPDSGKQNKGKPPLININSKDLLWRGVTLGQLNLTSQRSNNGIVSQITLSDKNYQLDLNADWQYQNSHHRTRLKGELKTEKFGELLKHLDFSKQIKETSATVKLDFDWQTPPYQVSLAKLNGSLTLNLSEGRILGIEPGFGRLLGVLAMKQWLKRLQFNFDDIYKEGLSFNTITGFFKLENGVAYNDNLVIDAIPAKISLKGKISLDEQTLDQQVSVVPKSSDSIPIAGTIIGSIATAIAQTVTGEYEEGYYLRSKYQVAGHWTDLKITPLHEQDGLLKKTWRGLTDFSWLKQQEQD